MNQFFTNLFYVLILFLLIINRLCENISNIDEKHTNDVDSWDNYSKRHMSEIALRDMLSKCKYNRVKRVFFSFSM